MIPWTGETPVVNISGFQFVFINLNLCILMVF